MVKFLILCWLVLPMAALNETADPNIVCGKWMSTEKNLEVKVYRDGDDYRAKIVWFLSSDKNKQPADWLDIHNPDPALRNRKIIGMSILKDMVYKPKSNSWEDGKIYDALHGREWDASAYIDAKGQLKVTGYWHFKFIGRTLTFIRVVD